MASINIGGRDFDVRECTIGLWRRKVRPFQDRFKDDASIAALSGEQVIDLTVDLILAFTGHKDGVTKEVIEDLLPFPMPPTLVPELLAAAGLRTKEPAAETDSEVTNGE